MRYPLLISWLLTMASTAVAQSFSAPESVAYDAVRRRWIVSQNGANRLDTYAPATGQLTTLSGAVTSGPHGLEVVGDTVYACDGGRIRGYSLASGALVFDANLGGVFLNGLAADGGRYLFASDFSTRRIYRVNRVTGAFNVLATAARTPNGLYFDRPGRRLVFVTWGAAAPVQAVSLLDSTISTLRATTLTNCDGLTRDRTGRWYVSAWGTNALHAFDAGFTAPPTTVLTGLSNPADIELNAAGDSIGIPNSGAANNVVFYAVGGALGRAEGAGAAAPPVRVWPNPATTQCVVLTDAPGPGAWLTLFDAAGRRVRYQPVTAAHTVLTRGPLPAGYYHLMVTEAARAPRAAQRVVFVD